MAEKAASRNYRDLLVWQKGIDLVEVIYTLADGFPKREVYGLANQMQRAATSIPSNIAEGQARSSVNEFRRFLRMALGSLAELDTQLELAKRLKYVKPESASLTNDMILELRRMLYGLINSLPQQ